MPEVIRVVAAVIEHDGRYLVTQRRPAAVLPLLWEFPGGKVEPHESDAEALVREVSHRVGVQIKPGGLMSTVRHEYEHYTVELHLYECRLTEGEPRAVNVHQFRWAKSDDFDQLPFTPADEASMTKLLGLVSPSN
jgi:8-oxo-dGTP diphosphatase